MKEIDYLKQVSHDYQMVFDVRMHAYQELLNTGRSGLTLKIDSDTGLGQYALEGFADIVTTGEISVGQVTQTTRIPVALHISPGQQMTDTDWVRFHSVLLPNIRTGKTKVDAEILKYVLMLNMQVHGGTFSMVSERSELLWTTGFNFRDCSLPRMRQEIQHHGEIKGAFVPHIEMSIIAFEGGMLAEELFKLVMDAHQ